jgi:hypothetical protein
MSSDGKSANTDNGIKVLGGFFVYRAKPSTESKSIEIILASKKGDSKNQFAQKGEITGMVLIKQSGERKFMTYAPIDPSTYKVDKFMEYFKDTMLNNQYDDSVEKVFELEALGTLVNKLVVQTVEEENPTSTASSSSSSVVKPPRFFDNSEEVFLKKPISKKIQFTDKLGKKYKFDLIQILNKHIKNNKNTKKIRINAKDIYTIYFETPSDFENASEDDNNIRIYFIFNDKGYSIKSEKEDYFDYGAFKDFIDDNLIVEIE